MPRLGPVDQPLAVHEHAVAVEDHEVERAAGRHRLLVAGRTRGDLEVHPYRHAQHYKWPAEDSQRNPARKVPQGDLHSLTRHPLKRALATADTHRQIDPSQRTTNGAHAHDRRARVHPAQSLDLEQGKRRPLCEHQPPDRRRDAREGAAGRAPPVPALLAGDPERREGHGDARGAPRHGPHRRRVRRVDHPDQRRRAVRLGLRRGQSELEDPRPRSTARRPTSRRASSNPGPS